jgi:hypothetical protein
MTTITEEMLEAGVAMLNCSPNYRQDVPPEGKRGLVETIIAAALVAAPTEPKQDGRRLDTRVDHLTREYTRIDAQLFAKGREIEEICQIITALQQQVQALTDRLGKSEVHIEQIGGAVFNPPSLHPPLFEEEEDATPDQPAADDACLVEGVPRVDPTDPEQIRVVAAECAAWGSGDWEYLARGILNALADHLEGGK